MLFSLRSNQVLHKKRRLLFHESPYAQGQNRTEPKQDPGWSEILLSEEKLGGEKLGGESQENEGMKMSSRVSEGKSF